MCGPLRQRIHSLANPIGMHGRGIFLEFFLGEQINRDLLVCRSDDTSVFNAFPGTLHYFVYGGPAKLAPTFEKRYHGTIELGI